jgi:23S rRNA pseudouridine1911/1915/1917 synthase
MNADPDGDRRQQQKPKTQATVSPEKTPNPHFEIVWQDEHLLVVDKPAGLVVHPARGHREGTLSQLLAGTAAGGEEPERAGIVHRLDRDTSGLLLVACTEDAHRLLQAALRQRLIEREYLALVEGLPPARTGTIEAPIGRHPRVRTRMAVGGAAAREARTHFTLERSLRGGAAGGGGGVSLLRLRLDTGRTHQIRVHLQAIGHPICGDPEYGTSGQLGLERQFLHATRLAFAHPITGAQVEVHSPLPPDLQHALSRAEGDTSR